MRTPEEILLTEESALKLANKVAKEWYRDPNWASTTSLQPHIAAAILRVQKIAYLLGQIAGIEETNLYGSLEQEQSRLRDLRAEMAALEQK